MSYNLGRDEMFWRLGHEDTPELIQTDKLFFAKPIGTIEGPEFDRITIDGDILKEKCSLCGKNVMFSAFGTYGQSYVIHCETGDCLQITSRGLQIGVGSIEK